MNYHGTHQMVTAFKTHPTRASLRIAMATWWLCTLIISVAYSANLVAMMSVEVVSYPVNSLEELSTQSHTRIGITKGVFIQNLLEV